MGRASRLVVADVRSWGLLCIALNVTAGALTMGRSLWAAHGARFNVAAADALDLRKGAI